MGWAAVALPPIIHPDVLSRQALPAVESGHRAPEDGDAVRLIAVGPVPDDAVGTRHGRIENRRAVGRRVPRCDEGLLARLANPDDMIARWIIGIGAVLCAPAMIDFIDIAAFMRRLNAKGCLSALIDDPARVAVTKAVGVDETKFLAARRTEPTRWISAICDVAARQVVDVIEGRWPRGHDIPMWDGRAGEGE